jgi:hypothetical protein
MQKLILSVNFETPVCVEIFLVLAYIKNPAKECALRIAQAVLPTLSTPPKPSSKYKIYDPHIFWRPVCRKRRRLGNIMYNCPFKNLDIFVVSAKYFELLLIMQE